MSLPTPEQMAAMAREYSMVHPIAPPPKPDELGPLCRALAELAICCRLLCHVPGQNAATLANAAHTAVAGMQAHVSAMDGGAHNEEAPAPVYRNHTELLRLALMAASKVGRALYQDSEGKSIARQLPYLCSLHHFAYSQLLTLTAF